VGEAILVIDDEEDIRQILKTALERLGHRVVTAGSGEEAFALIEAHDFPIVLTDIQLPGMDGFEILGRLKKMRPDVEVIMITAHAGVRSAIDAMKGGAFDYVTKPFDLEEIGLVVSKAAEKGRLQRRLIELDRVVGERYSFRNIIGSSKGMQKVFDLVKKASRSDANILVRGESGTGKELVARAIHFHSARAKGPYITVDCGAIPGTLMESEIFGHAKGSFTGAAYTKKGLFEEAGGGTLFLDEVGEIPVALQPKLLRAIQEGEFRRLGENEVRKVDVRLIAATNRDLEQAIREGLFREELYYRLNVITITLPPLRERREDIPLLANHFLQKFHRPGEPKVSITPGALELLEAYKWPGNVRELENVMERALSLRESDVLHPRDLPEAIRRCGLVDSVLPREGRESLAENEKRHILRVLAKYGWHRKKTAGALGIDVSNLYRKIKKYGIEFPR
jgi:two-component system NtrC family response regulator